MLQLAGAIRPNDLRRRRQDESRARIEVLEERVEPNIRHPPGGQLVSRNKHAPSEMLRAILSARSINPTTRFAVERSTSPVIVTVFQLVSRQTDLCGPRQGQSFEHCGSVGDAGCLRYAGRARRARSEKLYCGTVTTCGKEKEKADTRREHF